MQHLAQAIWRQAPRCVDATIAELAYQAGIGASDPTDSSIYRLWLDGSTCRAWAWLFAPSSFEWAVHPGSPELLNEIIDWVEGQTPAGVALETTVRDADAHAQRLLRDHGFVEDPMRPWMRLNDRRLGDIEHPMLPRGYRLKTVADYGGDITKRVAVHQRSWAELGTRVSVETYPAVMQTWPYRSDLDFVLEADDGTPVAFALGWYDEQTSVCEFEPLGTDPVYRRRGLGRALLLLGLHRFRDVGADHALIASRGDEGMPLPVVLYESAGFRELSRQRPLILAPSRNIGS